VSPDRRPKEVTPDGGAYDGHLKPFGSDLKKVDFGNPYKFVPKEGPAPGQYENGSDYVKPRVPAAHIKEEVNPERRPAEVTPDGGAYDGHLKPFGSDLKKVDFGNPYKFVPKEGPAPGQYEQSSDYIKPRVPAAHIKEEVNPERRPVEATPDGGAYDGHLKPFGSDLKKVDFGNPYKFVPKEGPAPGQYEQSSDYIKPRVPAAHIKEEVNPERRPVEITPDGGAYDGHLKPFGSNLKNIDFGDPYKFVPKEGPAPGQYEQSSDYIKPRVPAALIREDVNPERRPQEVTPDGGAYDGHLTAFGSGLKTTANMGSKYKF